MGSVCQNKQICKHSLGNSNSVSSLPDLRSCSSSFVSLNIPHTFRCSSKSCFQCSSEQYVGNPQSGQLNVGGRKSMPSRRCSVSQTGHSPCLTIVSARCRRSLKGDFESGWKSSSWDRMGGVEGGDCTFGRVKSPMARVETRECGRGSNATESRPFVFAATCGKIALAVGSNLENRVDMGIELTADSKQTMRGEVWTLFFSHAFGLLDCKILRALFFFLSLSPFSLPPSL